MKRVIATGLLLATGLFALGAPASPSRDETAALDALKRAAMIEDYSEHDRLLEALGFKSSGAESRLLEDARFDPPVTYGRETRYELEAIQGHALSSAARAARLSIYRPKAGGKKSVTFETAVDTGLLCMTEAGFSAVFQPVERIRASHPGIDHLEHTVEGDNHRVVAAYFSDSGCVIRLYLMQ